MVPLCFRMAGARALSLLLILGPLASAAHAADEAPLLKQWLQAQENIRTWSAEVRQTRALKTLAQPLMATGQVWFASPNQFRWEIGQPAQTIALRTAEKMEVVYPRLKRIEVYSLNGANGPWKDMLALLEAGFPRTEAQLLEKFRIVSQQTTQGIHAVVMEPRSGSARKMMPEIQIGFDAKELQLRFTQLQFADGSTMRNDFTQTQLNPSLAPNLFTPPHDPAFQVVEPLKTPAR